jgi:hypothetical protein
MLLIGCSKEDTPDDIGLPDDEPVSGQDSKTDDTGSTEDVTDPGYVFEYNGVTIQMNTDVKPVLEALGEPQQYFEAESCAFKGLDKTWYYSGFELTTYPKDDKTDYISSVYFSDDSVSTPEGIYIGSTVEDMIAAYGENYKGGNNSYTYEKGESSIIFIAEEGEVTAITYLALVEGLQ